MKISLCGFYGYNNYGDTLMSSCIKSLFLGEGFEVEVFSDRASNESFSYKEKSCLDCDAVAVGGGGIVNPSFWFFKENFHEKLDKQKLILLNVNLTEESEKVLKLISDRLSLIVVRDKYSEGVAKKYTDNVLYAPDISFLDKKNKEEVVPGAKKVVSVCLNYYIFKNFFSSNNRDRVYAERAIIEIATFLDWLTEYHKYETRLIACQTDREVNDNTVNAVLNGFLKNKAKWIFNKDELEQNIKESTFIISSRYHSSLFALKEEVPFIDITHHSKNMSFLRDTGLEDCSVEFWFIELNKLQNTFGKIIKELDFCNVSSSYGVLTIESWKKVLNSIKSL